MGLIAEFRGGFFHTSVLFFIQATLFHTIFINTSKWSVLWLCTLSPLGPGTPVTPSGPRSPWRWKRLYFRNEIEKSSFDPLKWRSLPWGRLCLVCPDLQHLLPNPKRLKTITDDYKTIVWNEVWTKPGKFTCGPGDPADPVGPGSPSTPERPARPRNPGKPGGPTEPW